MPITRIFRRERQPGLNAAADRILVLGVGGAGGNAVRSVAGKLASIDLVAADTDPQALAAAAGVHRLRLGGATAAGRGAVRPSAEELDLLLDGVRVCFVAGGMGGGTGGAAAPAIAAEARGRGILTIGVATLPFRFEGARRTAQAQVDLAAFRRAADTLITVPNETLLKLCAPATQMTSAFGRVDAVLESAVRSVADLLTRPGLVNLSFADLAAVIRGMGNAVLGTGTAEGPDRAVRAAERASINPLIADVLGRSRRGLVSITGGEDLRLADVEAVVTAIAARMHPDADLIWGSATDPALTGSLRVSVIATDQHRPPRSAEARRACRDDRHVPEPNVVFNQGLFFGRCQHCRREILRSGRTWKPVPAGFRIVWRAADRPPAGWVPPYLSAGRPGARPALA